MEKKRKTTIRPVTASASTLAAGLCLFLALSPALRSQTPLPSRFKEQVDRLFQERFTASAPGAAVVVTLKGEPLLLKGYGLADVEHNVPITPDTKFNLSSVTKQFVAFSILLLEKEEKLGLDDDVRKHLPELPAFSSAVTLRHLLHHTSGLWEYSAIMHSFCGYVAGDRITRDAIMDMLKRQRTPLFEPGSQWDYCNTNYLLLAQVVERVGGVPIQEWAQKNIFDPLGMSDSLFRRNSSQLIPRLAECYTKEKGELVLNSASWVDYVGPSYLFTTVRDMARWMDNFRTKKVGGPEVVDKMFLKSTLNDGSKSFYGFGLGVSTPYGKLIIGHSGQTAGYKTEMLYCPELDLGIAVLANERSIDTAGLTYKIFDLFLGKPEAPSSAPAKKLEFIPYSREAAAGFGGGYIVEGPNLKMAVNPEEGFLHGAIFGMGEDVFYPTAERIFSDRAGENLIEFTDIRDGQSQTAAISVKGDKMTARRIALDAEGLEARLPGYLGDYYSETFGAVYAVRAENGRLVLHHRRTGDARMQPLDTDEFLCLLGFMKFTRNAGGEVVGFTLTPSDEKFHFQGFEFKKVND